MRGIRLGLVGLGPYIPSRFWQFWGLSVLSSDALCVLQGFVAHATTISPLAPAPAPSTSSSDPPTTQAALSYSWQSVLGPTEVGGSGYERRAMLSEVDDMLLDPAQSSPAWLDLYLGSMSHGFL